MVYRELPLDDAEIRFREVTATMPPPAAEQTGQGRVRKVVKSLPRKSK